MVNPTVLSSQPEVSARVIFCHHTYSFYALKDYMAYYIMLLSLVLFMESISQSGPKLSHLFFVDDSLLFCRANVQECQKVLDLLTLYEQASGQKINRNKTKIFFFFSPANPLPWMSKKLSKYSFRCRCFVPMKNTWVYRLS